MEGWFKTVFYPRDFIVLSCFCRIKKCGNICRFLWLSSLFHFHLDLVFLLSLLSLAWWTWILFSAILPQCGTFSWSYLVYWTQYILGHWYLTEDYLYLLATEMYRFLNFSYCPHSKLLTSPVSVRCSGVLMSVWYPVAFIFALGQFWCHASLGTVHGFSLMLIF